MLALPDLTTTTKYYSLQQLPFKPNKYQVGTRTPGKIRPEKWPVEPLCLRLWVAEKRQSSCVNRQQMSTAKFGPPHTATTVSKE